MLDPLSEWLRRTGRLGQATAVAYELPLMGRRVDLALVTGRGVTTAFELKLGNISRALEQAAYNRSSFHRSWVVTGNRPRQSAIDWAIQLGIGILYIQEREVSVTVPAVHHQPNIVAARRLQQLIRLKASRSRSATF
jgi:hypothetical protein